MAALFAGEVGRLRLRAMSTLDISHAAQSDTARDAFLPPVSESTYVAEVGGKRGLKERDLGSGARPEVASRGRAALTEPGCDAAQRGRTNASQSDRPGGKAGGRRYRGARANRHPDSENTSLSADLVVRELAK
jgi:hypothetical protein